MKRKAAGTLRVHGHGRSSHSGSAPDQGRNALLGARRGCAGGGRPCTTRRRPDRLTAVPTILRSGDAFNVVPAGGELFCDLRADRLEAFDAVLGAVPAEHDEVRLEPSWCGLAGHGRARGDRGRLLAAAGERLGRPIVGSERGGASDASHMARARSR